VCVRVRVRVRVRLRLRVRKLTVNQVLRFSGFSKDEKLNAVSCPELLLVCSGVCSHVITSCALETSNLSPRCAILDMCLTSCPGPPPHHRVLLQRLHAERERA
jgi:hypothetical protein